MSRLLRAETADTNNDYVYRDSTLFFHYVATDFTSVSHGWGIAYGSGADGMTLAWDFASEAEAQGKIHDLIAELNGDSRSRLFVQDGSTATLMDRIKIVPDTSQYRPEGWSYNPFPTGTLYATRALAIAAADTFVATSIPGVHVLDVPTFLA